MLMMRRAAVLLVGVAILGCAGGADQVSGPGRTFDTLEPSFQAGGATQQVTGHANIFLPNFQAEEKYSNSAIRHADGTFSGEFQLKSEQDGGITVHGNVICFTIVANRVARMAGVVEKSNPAGFEGAHVVWTIADNGEGAKDPPDQTSDFFVVPPAIAQAHCATGFNLPLLPVLGGNLQVHP
jgi:hypothetical protein